MTMSRTLLHSLSYLPPSSSFQCCSLLSTSPSLSFGHFLDTSSIRVCSTYISIVMQGFDSTPISYARYVARSSNVSQSLTMSPFTVVLNELQICRSERASDLHSRTMTWYTRLTQTSVINPSSWLLIPIILLSHQHLPIFIVLRKVLRMPETHSKACHSWSTNHPIRRCTSSYDLQYLWSLSHFFRPCTISDCHHNICVCGMVTMSVLFSSECVLMLLSLHVLSWLHRAQSL